MRFHHAALAAALAGCAGDTIIEEPIGRVDAGLPPDAGTDMTADAGPTGTGCAAGASFELGSGFREWRAVQDGDLLYLYRGPQGGYMLYLSVHARGFDPADVTLCYELHVVDTDKFAGEGCWNVQLPNDLGGGMYERVGVWGQIDESLWTRSSQVRGHTVRVDAELSDDSGCTLSDGWTVDVHPDPPP